MSKIIDAMKKDCPVGSKVDGKFFEIEGDLEVVGYDLAGVIGDEDPIVLARLNGNKEIPLVELPYKYLMKME